MHLNSVHVHKFVGAEYGLLLTQNIEQYENIAELSQDSGVKV